MTSVTAPFLPGYSQSYQDPDAALARVGEIYQANTAWLRERFQALVRGQGAVERSSACYPYVQVSTQRATRVDTRLSYGFVPGPGAYHTTLTRPDLFEGYYREQFKLLLASHQVPLEVGVSQQPIPLHFAFPDGIHVEGRLEPEVAGRLTEQFHLPDLQVMDDRIVNGTLSVAMDQPRPLALFTAPRVDFSLQRLRHYTATSPEHFQNYVIFTNYQFYIDEFIRYGHRLMQDPQTDFSAFVEPGDQFTPHRCFDQAPRGTPAARLPQMPAYHLLRPDRSGLTMVNIGVGPSNAKTITDHIAVMRPHAWLMLGHCAGLRNTQRLGDYVLAHGYVRDDHVLDDDLPLWVPLPALAEVQQALEGAVERITGLSGYALKEVMRTGTVATVDDRNWELRHYLEPMRRFSQSRAIAVDMESATIAANGFRFRVPYGTLLCVSDKPLHGQIKLPGMADDFYRRQVNQHLEIGLLAMELLRGNGLERLHSRKLRSFAEVAFQ